MPIPVFPGNTVPLSSISTLYTVLRSSLTMRGLLPPTPSGTPRGARLVRSPGEAGQRQGNSDPFPLCFERVI
eukprot:1177247-Prorocentrum_minimum.AAC.5